MRGGEEGRSWEEVRGGGEEGRSWDEGCLPPDAPLGAARRVT